MDVSNRKVGPALAKTKGKAGLLFQGIVSCLGGTPEVTRHILGTVNPVELSAELAAGGKLSASVGINRFSLIPLRR